MRLAQTPRDPTYWRYGFAHFGKSLFWYTSELLFAYYLSEVCQLPARAMGAVLAVGFLAGAVADLWVGMAFAGRLTSAGGAARLQAFGAAASAATLTLLFAGASLTLDARLPYVLVVGLAFRVAYAIYDLPQNALLTLATDSLDQRVRYSSLRLFFSGAASLAVAASTGPLLSTVIPLDRPLRYIALALAWSAVGLWSAWRLSRGLWPHAADPAPRAARRPLLQALVPPREVRPLLGLFFFVSATASVFGKVEPYYASFVIRAPFWGGAILMAMSGATALSQPLWSMLAPRLGHRRLLMLCSGLTIGASLMFVAWARIPAVALALAALIGAANGGVGAILWARFADAVARAPAGRRGAAYGLLTAAIKVALGFSGLLIGEVLARIDYRGGQSDVLSLLMAFAAMSGAAVVLASSWREPRSSGAQRK
jgi:Na+/melibiose symporter-like transporter